MRAILFSCLIVLLFSQCKKDIPSNENKSIISSGIDSAQVSNTYIVWLDGKEFPPVVDSTNAFESLSDELYQKSVASKKQKIKNFARKFHIGLNDDEIFVHMISGFIFYSTTPDVADSLKADGFVNSVEPDILIQNTRPTMQNGGNPVMQNTRPVMQSDPRFGYDVPSYTSKSILAMGGGVVLPPNQRNKEKVWIIDSGIDSLHQDLIESYVPSISKSFVDNEPGKDMAGHGTHIAGLIAAIPHNKSNPQDTLLIGMAGMSPGAPVVSLKVFDNQNRTSYSLIIEALEYIMKAKKGKKRDIINLSLGGPGCDLSALEGLLEAYSAYGIFITIAAGNAAEDSAPVPSDYFYPACTNGENIYTIGSFGLNYTTNSRIFSSFSNYNSPSVDYVLPGEFIFSSYPGDRYAIMDGTSMSSGIMAGLIHLTKGRITKGDSIPGIRGETYFYYIPKR